jgi:hypothetical protein
MVWGVLALLLLGVAPAVAGHSVGHFPSYYPGEIRIETVDPAAAAKGLADGTLQTYVGEQPAFTGTVPAHVTRVTSLSSLVVLTFNPKVAAYASAEARCQSARAVAATLRDAQVQGFVYHPYPVTPYHADYLEHLDRAEATMRAIASTTPVGASFRIRATSRIAKAIAGARVALTDGAADVVLELVSVEALVADAGAQLGDRSGPPWVKEGWFQARRLLIPERGAARQDETDSDETYRRLMRGQYANLAERLTLERRLVDSMTRDCTRVVLGYTERAEHSNITFEHGVENIAVDSQQGLNAPVFVRTVKLKEYPWNGSLRLGVPARAESAWNPVAGFNDPTGRLIWAALGDPAMIPFPDNASWLPNRVHFEADVKHGQSGGFRLPADALRPEPGSGALKPVGSGQFASAKVVYEAMTSPYLDDSEATMADVIYPYVFTYRWGLAKDANDETYEPRLAAALNNIRDRLVGFKPLRVDRRVKAIAEGFELVQHVPVIEVYLKEAHGDDSQVAALTPPWSTVPWHLLALMEDAVLRGDAAFSKEEALRRGTGWLDLVRDEPLRTKMLERIAVFEREGFRPDALKGYVTVEEARKRWGALRAFAEKHGHLLVTNGPYRLKQWSADSVVLDAVREPSYPIGFGTFDRVANPPRALVRDAMHKDGKIIVKADAEFVVKAERDYRIVREPLTRKSSNRLFGLLVVSRYLLIRPDGTVMKADKMHWDEDDRFIIALPKGLAPGGYTVILAIFLDGNTINPHARMLRLRVDEKGVSH